MERVIEAEWLDELPSNDDGAVGSRKDLQRLNAWMGSARRFANLLREVLKPGVTCRVADLGGGDGRFFLNAARRLGVQGASGKVVIVDRHSIVSGDTTNALTKLGWESCVVQSDVFDWLEQPNDGLWDLMVANLFLHHFSDSQVLRLLRLVAGRTKTFVALEPRRSPLALAFSRFVALIGCNHVTRHDAPASVRAGFSRNELSRLWSADGNGLLEERAVGCFGHMFVARLVSQAGISNFRNQMKRTGEKPLVSAQS